MIKFENVSVLYPGTEEPAIKNVSIGFEQGEFVCVLGRSGAGKSTFIRCINGLQPVSEGNVKWDGKSLSEMTPKEN
jgi:phosphonate transport system ATP-binding protein